MMDLVGFIVKIAFSMHPTRLSGYKKRNAAGKPSKLAAKEEHNVSSSGLISYCGILTR